MYTVKIRQNGRLGGKKKICHSSNHMKDSLALTTSKMNTTVLSTRGQMLKNGVEAFLSSVCHTIWWRLIATVTMDVMAV